MCVRTTYVRPHQRQNHVANHCITSITGKLNIRTLGLIREEKENMAIIVTIKQTRTQFRGSSEQTNPIPFSPPR